MTKEVIPMKKWLALATLPLAYTVGATLYARMKKPSRITRSLASPNTVYLTFDDGPNPYYTPQLLDLLKRYDAKATFFVVGELAQKYPHLLRRMHKEGHAIGIHHYAHKSAWQLTPHQLQQQIEQTLRIIYAITGVRTHLYRPPWGHFNAATMHIAKHDYVVLWSHIFKDWKATHNNLHLLKHPIADGSILLLHDNGDTKGADSTAPSVMLKALEGFLATATQQFLALPGEDNEC